MDLWIVAAAAGVGYIAKNIQNLSVDIKESPVEHSYKYPSNSSTSFLQQLREKTCPLRRLARKTAQDVADVDFSEFYRSSNTYKEADSEDYNMGPVSSLPSVYSTKEESLYFPENAENRNIRRANRHMCRLRCLDEKMEDKTFLCSPNISKVGPLLITDDSYSSFSELVGCKDEMRKENGVGSTNVIMRSSSLDRSDKLRKPKECLGNSEMSGSGEEEFHSQGTGMMLLLITGMTVGIITATTAWKNEVDKLNKQLQLMQSLVQDLHEELNTKEIVIVKDLRYEDLRYDAAENERPLSAQQPIASLSDMEVNDKSEKSNSPNGNSNDHNNCAESLELLSKIEAELQAELEMLENNMNASASLKRSNSNSSVVEFDRDFGVQGEIKSTTINTASDSENETTDYRHSNYAVSPRDLSLRLHELIESRLETRIYELEAALANNICVDDEYKDREDEGNKRRSSTSFMLDEHGGNDDETDFVEGGKLSVSLSF